MASPKRSRARAKNVAGDALWDEPRAASLWPDVLAEPARSLRDVLGRWCAAELAPGQLVPWGAVAFGFGIVLYFTAAQEPLWWAPLVVVVFAIVGAIAARRRPAIFVFTVGIAALASGFAIATLKTKLIAHPVLSVPVFGAAVTGFVETREERERSERIVVRVHSIDGTREKLARVRVSVRKGTAPAVGAFVSFKARLSPPLQPLRPGGYDFARDLYFHEIGASGFVLGRISQAEAPTPLGWRLRFAAAVDTLRDGMDNRIRAVLPGDRGAIASALITGKRDTISAPVNEAMYVSSLAHVLSISGYHMAVVAGLVFFVIRALLALIPTMSDRYPIKKWAAFVALAAATFYLLLSGAEVATQRSYIMIAIVLAGVMIDRPAITVRTLTVAAMLVLILTPESVVHPSFQMSFAATLALVAGYRYGLPWRADHDSGLGTRATLWGARELIGLVLASIVAGLATTPYAAFHFHRLAPYGVISNLAAMPVVSAFVMPMGILGALAMPFGFDGVFWELMGKGLDWMTGVALWVTQLPGAVGHIAAFGTGPLLIGTLGMLLICLLRTPLRLAGVVAVALAIVLATATHQPDVLVASDGQAVAVRNAHGRLGVARAGSDSFAVRDWLAADGDTRAVNDPTLGEDVRCDEAGCILPLPDGRLVAFAKTPEAFPEDCRRAAVVVSARVAQRDCAAQLIDRPVWRAQGAITLRRDGNGFVLTPAQPRGTARPWSMHVQQHTPSTTIRRPAPDATPRSEDLEAGE